MAQTEMMLRLLLKGKIVGYEWKLSSKRWHSDECTGFRKKNEENPNLRICYPCRGTHEDSSLGRAYSTDMKNWNGKEIEHDSFELGIKVGDEWWFEGDKFIPKEDDRKFVLNFTGEAWWIHSIDDKEIGDSIGIDMPIPGIIPWLENAERIGTIHDKENNENI